MKHVLLCCFFAASLVNGYAQDTTSISKFHPHREVVKEIPPLSKKDFSSCVDKLNKSIEKNKKEDADNNFNRVLATMRTDIRRVDMDLRKATPEDKKHIKKLVKKKSEILNTVIPYHFDVIANKVAINEQLTAYEKTIL